MSVLPERERERGREGGRERETEREREREREGGREGERERQREREREREREWVSLQVVFREGQLLSGVLDKSQLGASQFGFVHCCQELYGGGMANQLLSALGRLLTTFLQLHGFTLGTEDIIVRPEVWCEG